MGITGPPLKLIQSFPNNRLRRVVLNCQNSSLSPMVFVVPQGSVLTTLFFLIHIKDLTEGISSTTKLFADDTTLFSVVNNVNESAKEYRSIKDITLGLPVSLHRTGTFKHYCFPWAVVEWNKIHPDIRNAFIIVLKKLLLK